MVNIKDVRAGNLLIHKDVGVCLVVGMKANTRYPDRSIVQGCDNDESIYSGPCEDWFYLWTDPDKVAEYAAAIKAKEAAKAERKLKREKKNKK
jgi:hypothetical protein